MFSCLAIWFQVGLWYLLDPTKFSTQTIVSGDNSVNVQVNGDIHNK